MLTKLLNFFGIKTQKQKAEEYQAAAAKCPYLNSSNVSPELNSPAVEVVTIAPTNDLQTMQSPAQASPVLPTTITVDVTQEPAKTQDTFTINLTSDTIKFNEPEQTPQTNRGRKSKSKPQAASTATKPAVIKGTKKKK